MSISDDILKVRKTKGTVSGKLMFMIVSFGFSLILSFAFVVPEYENMQSLKVEERVKAKNIEAKKETLNNILDFKKNIENINYSDLEKVKVFFPSHNKIEFHLSNIDSLKRMYRLSLYDVDVSEASSGKGQKKGDTLILQGKEVKKTNLKFKVGGDFSSIVSFVYSLERNIPFTNIEDLKILTKTDKIVDKETGKESEIKSIWAEISLAIYHY